MVSSYVGRVAGEAMILSQARWRVGSTKGNGQENLADSRDVVEFVDGVLRAQSAVTAAPRLGVPSGGASFVPVVQTADFREGDHVTLGDALARVEALARLSPTRDVFANRDSSRHTPSRCAASAARRAR